MPDTIDTTTTQGGQGAVPEGARALEGEVAASQVAVESGAEAAAAQAPVDYSGLALPEGFYDGVQLHPIGARILWSGPPGLSLAPVDAPRRRSAGEAPIFGDPLAGRGDGAPVKAARPGDQVVLVQ